jgi:hypothetical protein
MRCGPMSETRKRVLRTATVLGSRNDGWGFQDPCSGFKLSDFWFRVCGVTLGRDRGERPRVLLRSAPQTPSFEMCTAACTQSPCMGLFFSAPEVSEFA